MMAVKFRYIQGTVWKFHYFPIIQNLREITIVNSIGAQCGNYGNLLSLFFGKNFVKVTILLTKLLNS